MRLILMSIFILLYNVSCNSQKSEVQESYYKNGVKKDSGMIVKGKKHGIWKHWYENGQITSVREYNNGNRIGLSRVWFRNGKLKDSIKYTNDSKQIYWYAFHQNGKKNLEQVYNPPESMTELFKIYYKNGQLSQKGKLLKGKNYGKWVEYDKKGNLISIQFYDKEGARSGLWYKFNEDGDTLKVENYN